MKTREFQDMSSMLMHFVQLEASLRTAEKRGLERCAQLVEKTAKDEIGYYQPEVGSFPAWAQLADSTEKQKEAMGAPLGAPLLRTGELYASIQHETTDKEAVIGSTDPVMEFHEFGTSKMSPRPVMGPALFVNRKKIQKILGAAILEGVLGGQVVDAGGYFGEDIKP